MKGMKFAFSVACLGAVYASAYSQEKGEAFTQLFFGTYQGSGVYVSNVSYVSYTLVGGYASGSGYYLDIPYGQYDPLGSACGNISYSLAGPGDGFAEVGMGYAIYLTFTNNNANGSSASFGVYTNQRNLQNAVATTSGATASSFGGITELGGEYFHGYAGLTEVGYTIANEYSLNWNVFYSYFSPGYAGLYSSGSFRDYLAFGESITVKVWVNGTSSARSGSSVPAPAAIAPFALGLVGAIRRRKR